ncbi:hypothetical protein [Spiroplasma endosymbiont of Seladonia tumulorum]|uniref:hypothetical protein n=1 Tax=Spiroplasma endosymbiont of Seladonia tumulorum TaxID=3066321 RepID=UPI0030D49434
MKKLLSLLSVLTIGGSATTTIATSHYKKSVDNINYSQKINLKKIIRNKRENDKKLNDLLKTWFLGILDKNDEETILNKICELNKKIQKRNIKITNISEISARVIWNNNENSDDYMWVGFQLASSVGTKIVGHSCFYTPSNEESYDSSSNWECKNVLPNTSNSSIENNGRLVGNSRFFDNSNIKQVDNSGITTQKNKKIQRPKIAPPTPPTKTKEPLYATVLPKSQRNIKSNVAPQKPPRNLNNLLLNTNLGELQDNLSDTILNRFIELNVNINRNQISISNITTTSAIIIPNQNSRYIGNLEVFFTLNYKDKKNLIKISDNEKDNDSNSNNNQKIKDIINKFNNLSKQSKQKKLNEINQHYQSLPKNEQKAFKDKLRDVGLGLTSTGISGAGILGISKMTGISPIKGLSITRTVVSSETGEAVEMTPLLSESTVAEGLTAAETLSVAEESAVVVTEGAFIGTEAGTAAALAPETLGLSLIIGGLVIAGTAILWWINSNHTIVKHESHNQYNEIEKYYKFLAHDQLKLDININEWNKIKQIYQENANNYQQFKNKIKSKISNFHKEDHSGWGGSITDNDINTLINILYNHFQEINNHFLSNHNHGWKIITNTVGSYFIIEEE